MTHDYYLQTDSTQSVRRYPKAGDIGERWNREQKVWSTECADRRSCELTHDWVLSEDEARKMTG